MTKVLLYSGGMDSVLLDHLWRPDVRVYVDMGTGYTSAERDRLPDDVLVVDLPLAQWERPDRIIPLRNLMLVCVAAQYGQQVAMAATAGDRVLDKSYEFAERTSGLLSYLWRPQHWTEGEPRDVVLPIKHLTKRQAVATVVAQRGLEVAERAAVESFSCYQPVDGRECGACKPCARKWVAFTAEGIACSVDARAWVLAEYLPLIASGQFGRYDEQYDVLAAFGHVDPENPAAAAQSLLTKETA